MKVKISSPKGVLVEKEDIHSVTLPGIDGEMCILPEHTLLLSELVRGNIIYRWIEEDELRQKSIHIENGLAKVDPKKVLVLLDL